MMLVYWDQRKDDSKNLERFFMQKETFKKVGFYSFYSIIKTINRNETR